MFVSPDAVSVPDAAIFQPAIPQRVFVGAHCNTPSVVYVSLQRDVAFLGNVSRIRVSAKRVFGALL